MISFCKIRRHMRVMFSTTTGVLMFTAMRKRLRAGDGRKGSHNHNTRLLTNRDRMRFALSASPLYWYHNTLESLSFAETPYPDMFPKLTTA